MKFNNNKIKKVISRHWPISNNALVRFSFQKQPVSIFFFLFFFFGGGGGAANVCDIHITWTYFGVKMDPTYGIHSHKTLDPAQPCHLQSQIENLPLLTVFMPQLISIPSFC